MFPKNRGATLFPVYKGGFQSRQNGGCFLNTEARLCVQYTRAPLIFLRGFLRLEISDNSRDRKKNLVYGKNSLERSIYPHLQGADSVRVRGNLRKTIDFRGNRPGSNENPH